MILKLFNKNIKSICFIPTIVHHSLLVDKKVGVSICNDNFCLCDNIIKKIIKETNIDKKKKENYSCTNKCD